MDIAALNKAKRFQLLFAIYIASDADYEYSLNVMQIGEQRGFSDRETQKIFKYLLEEKFIELRDGGGEYQAAITHKGVKAVEEVFIDQQKSTYYFPAYREIRTKYSA